MPISFSLTPPPHIRMWLTQLQGLRSPLMCRLQLGSQETLASFSLQAKKQEHGGARAGDDGHLS